MVYATVNNVKNQDVMSANHSRGRVLIIQSEYLP